MIRDDPHLDLDAIAAGVETAYGIRASSLEFLPLGFDMAAAVYRLNATDGSTYFLKTRTDPVYEPGLDVARALLEAGIDNVVAPLPTRSGDLWCRLGERNVILYPFVTGENAAVVGMSDDQWVEFGRTLRAVHDSSLPRPFRDHLPTETFDLPSATLTRQTLANPTVHIDSLETHRFAAFWSDHAERTGAILTRAEELGRELGTRPFELVLCHADIHAANILVGTDGRIHLVDWDGPKIAPRERDLLFVVGSTIARTVEPHEETAFFQGYGPLAIDPSALAYFRYERAVEDLGLIAGDVLTDPTLSEDMRRASADIAIEFFAPGGFLDRAEVVDRHGW